MFVYCSVFIFAFTGQSPKSYITTHLFYAENNHDGGGRIEPD